MEGLDAGRLRRVSARRPSLRGGLCRRSPRWAAERGTKSHRSRSRYHYTNNNDVYVPVRWAVSAYVWLTGFGNGVYFWSSADFSAKRFTQQLWRMNFLCLFLSLATGTPWIEYYFVALATVHFVLIWVSLAIARVIGTLVGWEKPDKKEHREACYAEKALGCALMIGLCCIIWLDPHNDGKGVYDVLLRPWLLDIDGEHYFEWYFWMRTKMDFLSSVPGLCFAAVYTPFRDAWPFGISRLARWGMGACASTLIALAIWVSQLPQYCCDGGADYRSVNPYVGTLWIPFYLLARNAIPALSRRIMKPIEWVGMHSLEFYLLQFHVFLTDGSHQILYIIPKEDWGYTNMLLVGCIYFVCCIKALEITNVLRSVAWRADKWKVAPGVGRDSVVFTYMCSLRARPRKIPRQTSRNDFDSTALEKLDQDPPPNRRFRGLARTCLRSRMSAKATDPPPTLPPSPLDALQPYRPPPWTLG